MTGAFGLALATFGLLAVVFVPLEHAFAARPRRSWRSRGWREDLGFFAGQYLVWSAGAVAVLGLVRQASAGVIPAGLRSAVAGQPMWLQLASVIVVGDLCVYWFHRACHRFDVLWRFHAVHHGAEDLDWLAAHREHPLDGLCTQVVQNLPALLAGVPLGVVAPLVVFRGAWGIFIHSNVRASLGPLGLLLGAPDLHRWHHVRDRATDNFANLAPWLDVVFGTYHRPGADEAYEIGLREPAPRGYVAQLAWPFRRHRAVQAVLHSWAASPHLSICFTAAAPFVRATAKHASLFFLHFSRQSATEGALPASADADFAVEALGAGCAGVAAGRGSSGGGAGAALAAGSGVGAGVGEGEGEGSVDGQPSS